MCFRMGHPYGVHDQLQKKAERHFYVLVVLFFLSPDYGAVTTAISAIVGGIVCLGE